MSLLDSGPETLVVYPNKWGTDEDGNERWLPWAPGDPVVTLENAQVQVSESDTVAVNGQRLDTQMLVIGRSLPDAMSRRWDRIEWEGRTFDLVQEPRTARRGSLTRHYWFLMQERS